MRLRAALRLYLPHALAIAGIAVLALVVTAYLVVHQRLDFPWQHARTLFAEFSSAQAVTPGQGQTVNVAGVQVGEIAGVQLKDGVARVQMRLTSNELGPVYRNARLLLRPKTGLNDMSIDLDPGTPDGTLPNAGKLPDGAVLPVANTAPQVNLDEVLASLDTDTRNYLVTLATAGGQGLDGRGVDVRRLISASEPTLAETARVMHAFADRRAKVARLVTNLRLLSHAAASKDRQLASLVGNLGGVMHTLATHDSDLAATVSNLPPTLSSLSTALSATRGLAVDLKPALTTLEPTVRDLPSALVAARPLLRKAAPTIKSHLRPLVKAAIPLVAKLRPSVNWLNGADPELIRSADALNYAVNELAYNPPGGQHGYLFWLAWFMHNSSSILSVQDAQGAAWRGLVMIGCSTAAVVTNRVPELAALAKSPVCPSPSGGGG